jgi:hypothetical protein
LWPHPDIATTRKTEERRRFMAVTEPWEDVARRRRTDDDE